MRRSTHRPKCVGYLEKLREKVKDIVGSRRAHFNFNVNFRLLPVVNSTRLSGDLINSGTGDIKKNWKTIILILGKRDETEPPPPWGRNTVE